MGYSPWGRKKSDTSEQLTYVTSTVIDECRAEVYFDLQSF